ncbi:MAG: quinone-dependent dihydroorotate dehydrogenase [Jaaginema sp. PMC 1079.18]|nr:quinone-dependent dihydroorotate dehydrogenase [Jaaginema sp. PMC 1080.18]MEC4852909.1 quinone-dependent dihydroorotate dehydrogenase [Jaaginema sp. PMC 1079.18]MEC4868856.1 quinone-dependent dihydroorotate dehydrogenase [Jaaginema sp. PMC 1078.18]
MDIYRAAVRPLLFNQLKVDPEWAHLRSLIVLDWLNRGRDRPLSQLWLQPLSQIFCRRDARLQQTLWGVDFPNPLGLAAGFDKNGVAAGVWENFGFGFAELGTVTLHSQPGNPQPRLFRLTADEAVLNRMGFNNEGSTALASRLQSQNCGIPLGINLGKSKITPLEQAASDYLGSFQKLQDFGDYFVVNVSSPNTPGLRSLQDKEQLNVILEALQAHNPARKPILVKIAPDLSWDAIADVLELAGIHHLAGIIATNTTIRRDNLKTQVIPETQRRVLDEAGGISGKPLRDRATEIIRFIWQQTQGQLPIIGVGGIFTPEDAWEKITAGASLVQVYTGWIYEGPWIAARILTGLSHYLDTHELNSISDAVGLYS